MPFEPSNRGARTLKASPASLNDCDRTLAAMATMARQRWSSIGFFNGKAPEGKIIELWRIFHKSLAKLRVNRKNPWMNL